MIDAKLIVEQLRTAAVLNATDEAAFRNFGHAAARIRKDAAASIQTSDDPSQPGKPPHTQRGQLRRALRFAADKQGAVIGPRASFVGTSGEAHELGGSYRGEQYPERPYMQPALEQNLDRFAQDWAGSIGE